MEKVRSTPHIQEEKSVKVVEAIQLHAQEFPAYGWTGMFWKEGFISNLDIKHPWPRFWITEITLSTVIQCNEKSLGVIWALTLVECCLGYERCKIVRNPWSVLGRSTQHYKPWMGSLVMKNRKIRREPNSQSCRYCNFTHRVVYFHRDLSSNSIKSLPVRVFTDLTQLYHL